MVTADEILGQYISPTRDHSLHLDHSIRDYALLPVVLMVVLSNLFRSSLSVVFPPPTNKPDPMEMSVRGMVRRAKAFLQHGDRLLAPKQWAARKLYFVHADQGVLRKPPASKSAVDKMMESGGDPSAAFGALKHQFLNIGLQIFVGYVVNLLYAGYLVAKTPFPLTFKMKPMLQRGVEVPDLSSSYISSLSWYFVVMIASSGLVQTIHIILRGIWPKRESAELTDPVYANDVIHIKDVDESKDGGDDGSVMAMAMTGGAMQQAPANPLGGPAVDFAALYKAELDLIEHKQHNAAAYGSE